MRAAGYEPKTRLPVAKSLAKAASPKSNRHDWRCRACVNAGHLADYFGKRRQLIKTSASSA